MASLFFNCCHFPSPSPRFSDPRCSTTKSTKSSSTISSSKKILNYKILNYKILDYKILNYKILNYKILLKILNMINKAFTCCLAWSALAPPFSLPAPV